MALTLVLACSSATPAQDTAEGPDAYSTPQYVDDDARTVIEGMVEAHGGLDRWIRVPSLSYTANMYLTSLPLTNEQFPQDRRYFDNWRYYRVTLDPQTSRALAELPLERPGEPSVGFDGRELWALPYEFDPPFKESPQALLYFHYGMIALPWLTQQADVTLKSLEDAPMPDGVRRYHVVEMTFDPPGRAHAGSYTLYIDKETNLLRGFTNSAPYPLLPGPVFTEDTGAGNPPTIFRYTDAYMEVDGLVLPRSYVTLRETDDGLHILGAHLVLDPSVSGDLDGALLSRPEGANLVRTVQATGRDGEESR